AFSRLIMQAKILSGSRLLPLLSSSNAGSAARMRGINRARICAPQAYRPVELNANPQIGLALRTTSVITATTDVVISVKSKLEFASVDRSGTAVSRISTIRITLRQFRLTESAGFLRP